MGLAVVVKYFLVVCSCDVKNLELARVSIVENFVRQRWSMNFWSKVCALHARLTLGPPLWNATRLGSMARVDRQPASQAAFFLRDKKVSLSTSLQGLPVDDWLTRKFKNWRPCYACTRRKWLKKVWEREVAMLTLTEPCLDGFKWKDNEGLQVIGRWLVGVPRRRANVLICF